MSHRPFLALPRILTALSLMAASLAAVAQTQDAHGIRVRAACLQTSPAPRLLADLSCENAMDCWSDPAALDVIDVDTGARLPGSGQNLLYVDAAGAPQSEPPMQGTIRAVWTLVFAEPVSARRFQLAQGDETASAAFAAAADCAALPAAAVRRLGGG